MKSNKNELSSKQREELLKALKTRLEKNLNRHKGLDWAKVQARLEAKLDKLWSLAEMERTGGALPQKSMKPIQGYHLIRPGDHSRQISRLMQIPNADAAGI